MVALIFIPTNNVWKFPFLYTVLQNLLFIDSLMMAILTGVIPDCSFDLRFSDN